MTLLSAPWLGSGVGSTSRGRAGRACVVVVGAGGSVVEVGDRPVFGMQLHDRGRDLLLVEDGGCDAVSGGLERARDGPCGRLPSVGLGVELVGELELLCVLVPQTTKPDNGFGCVGESMELEPVALLGKDPEERVHEAVGGDVDINDVLEGVGSLERERIESEVVEKQCRICASFLLVLDDLGVSGENDMHTSQHTVPLFSAQCRASAECAVPVTTSGIAKTPPASLERRNPRHGRCNRRLNALSSLGVLSLSEECINLGANELPNTKEADVEMVHHGEGREYTWSEFRRECVERGELRFE